MLEPDFWPTPSPPAAFAERRRRLAARLDGPALIAAGESRPRNFQGNRFPFRADSHFAYLVGSAAEGAFEGAVLLIDPTRATLYAHPPEPGAALWTGPAPSLDELAARLELRVRPFEELRAPPNAAVLPPQETETALVLGELLDRDVEPGGGPALTGADAALADAMIALRLIHDEAAIAQLREAAEVTARAHRAGMARTRPGLREAQVRAAMEAEIIACGMSCSYGSIVSVHGEVLHNERHDGLVAAGELLLADVGAETPEGWAGDVTRAWPVSGRFTATQRALYEHLLAAQLAAIGAVRPGVRYLEVHRAAGKRLLEGLIAEGIFRGELDGLYERGAAALFFPHGVGHLLGLDVHDLEDLGDRAGYAPGRSRSEAPGDRYLRLDRELEPGMAVTIEPGFYRIDALLSDPARVGSLEPDLDRDALARFSDVRGIRIEDDVLVTERGAEVLTAAIPKRVAELEASVGG
ncbi:MAG: aminopeptidase P family protein [Sorangiineae bacterium]|nr:aminopeptidase P family protein [Sorangiineae bacterium]